MGEERDEVEWGIDLLQHFAWSSGFPWERWLINRQRRKEGKAPFRH